MDVVALLRSPENKTLEFKRDLSSPEGVLRTIVAFSNTAGGILLIGVEDKTRRVCGIEEPLPLEERIANIISDNIHPKLVPNIEVLLWRNTYVLAVEVFLSSSRPHYLKELGSEKGVFVRVGSTNRLADAQLIEDLRRSARNDTFDESPIPALNSEVIDFRVAAELFSVKRKLKPSDLETLQLITKCQERFVPTVGGLILFGYRDICMGHFPDAWIQAGRFTGKNKQHIKDTQEIRNYPALAVEEAMDFVQKHSMISLEIDRLHHAEKWSIPQIAIREAIINAIVHADYSQRGSPIRISIFDDRIEIENPGLLLTGLTIHDLEKGVSKLRNRVIGRVFHELGLIERWGSGIQRMMTACRDAGLGSPLLEEIGTHFRVTIYYAQQRKPQLKDKIEEAILAALKESNGLSTRQISLKIGLSIRATHARLAMLIKRGLVVVIGTSTKDPKRKYFLAK